MPLTPADVHNVAFSKPPIDKPGYHEGEVDAFLDLVEAELVRLIEHNNLLCGQLEMLDQRPHAGSIGTTPTSRPVCPVQHGMAPAPLPTKELLSTGEDPNVHATRVLGLAQKMADRLTSEAKAEADGMLSDARISAEQLLNEARTKAAGMVTEARARADTMLGDARTAVGALERQSRDNAAAQQQEAARRRTEIITGLTEEKNALENTLGELRAFERAYRASLAKYVQAQLHELGGDQPPGPADPTRGPAGLGDLRVRRA
jgi:DivIVA domain-containing protein